jgi:hypothetical protein
LIEHTHSLTLYWLRMSNRPILIDGKILGTHENLFVDDGFSWAPFVPQGAWHLSGDVKEETNTCLDTLLRLNGETLDLLPPKRFVTCMESLGCKSPPWGKIIPRDQYRIFLDKLVSSAVEILPKLDDQYYRGFWGQAGGILRALEPVKTDRPFLQGAISRGEFNGTVLKSLLPGGDGFAPLPRYDRFGTRTGRLTVKSGPQILTLKKDYRRAILSSFKDGSIISLDFSALEARILLYALGGSCPERDLYAKISREAFGTEERRKVVKGAVLAELFGSSRAALAAALGVSGPELQVFIGQIKRHFNIAPLVERLKAEFSALGFIKNAFGRRVSIDDPSPHILVNSFAQSSGVDVALLGFSSLLPHFSGREIRPLFVLHDALILDVSPEGKRLVEEIVSIRVPLFSESFPVKIEEKFVQ